MREGVCGCGRPGVIHSGAAERESVVVSRSPPQIEWSASEPTRRRVRLAAVDAAARADHAYVLPPSYDRAGARTPRKKVRDVSRASNERAPSNGWNTRRRYSGPARSRSARPRPRRARDDIYISRRTTTTTTRRTARRRSARRPAARYGVYVGGGGGVAAPRLCRISRARAVGGGRHVSLSSHVLWRPFSEVLWRRASSSEVL